MNKNLFFAMFLALILVFSISAIHATEVNVTESSMLNSSYDDAIQIVDDAQFDVLESVDSSNLSADLSNASLDAPIKNKTELTSPTTRMYYKGNYNVTLKDSSSNVTLANKNVFFVINNINYKAITDNNGVARVNLKLNPGKYVATAYFSGDDSYEASGNLTSDFEVLSTIKAGNISKYYKGSTKFSATFFNSQGNVLANKVVNININGKSYNKKTNKNGFVSIAVDLKPGTYKVVSTDPVTGCKLTTNFKILSTISSANLNKVEGDGKKFVVKFFKNNGKPLANKYVKIKIDGKTYKVKTNSNGKVSLQVDKLKKGEYKAVCYNNDGLSKSYKIKVFKIASTKLTSSFYTFFKNDTKEIKAKFTTCLDDDSNSGKTIKIKINDKTYSKKTDSDGMIYFNVSSFEKGIYKVEYKFDGNKFFKSAKSTNYVTILNDTSVTELTLESTTSFGNGAGTLFKVAYAADDVPLAKKTVTFKINGKTYAETTGYDGIASLPINLKVGNYTIGYKTNNEFKINGTSGSSEIEVFKRNATKLDWKSGSSFKDYSQSFKVLLTDTNGSAISDQTVELLVDGETYYADTELNGYAIFNTDVALGKYKISVIFRGSNEYISSSTSKSINVELSKFGNGLNEKNAISYLKAYLKSSDNCQVGNSKIKALVKSLTSNCTNKIDKAKAIFNYVRDTLDYSRYYDTKYGAVGTLKAKKGNCVDHTHLLVAMYRTAGFKARYVHGVCHFNSGNTYGHVWAQVLIGDKWVCADATSYSNALGKIADWDTNSYKIRAKYANLPF